jgi:uncharacterized protein involved in exopolysaccharide biosynthesis
VEIVAHITSAEGPGILTVLLVGAGAGLLLGLAIAGFRQRRRR